LLRLEQYWIVGRGIGCIGGGLWCLCGLMPSMKGEAGWGLVLALRRRRALSPIAAFHAAGDSAPRHANGGIGRRGRSIGSRS